MTDRPAIFSGPMVNAFLQNRKTQTRRLTTSPLAFTQAGDRLWVRETVACGACASGKPSQWAPSFWRREQGTPANPNGLWYQADGLEPETQITDRGKWVPCIHMPRWASRITLVVKEVRREPLGAISMEDALAEGILLHEPSGSFWVPGVEHWDKNFPILSRTTPQEMYAALWDQLHGSGSWLKAKNDPVVVLTFSVHHGNIDRMKDKANAG